jgi:hypothetical protein
MRRPHLVSLCILAYCAINSADLFGPWVQSRMLSVDAAAFFLWITPVAGFWLRRRTGAAPSGESPPALGIALMCSFIGMAGSLRVLCHLGFAVSLFALVPFAPLHLVWLASAGSWMPVFDWLGGRFFPGHVLAVKFGVAAFPALIATAIIRLRERGGA